MRSRLVIEMEKDKLYLTADELILEFSQDHASKYVTFVCDEIEIAIEVSSFDSFTNLVMITNDMWHGRGKDEE